MDFILTIHGLLRWLVAIAGLIAIIKFAYGWLSKADYTPLDKRIMSIFTILLDINLLLGLILLFGLGSFSPNQLEHATTMILAVITAHLSLIWRKSPNSAVKFRNNLIVVIIAFLFIIMGVTRLTGGWLF